MSGPGLPVDERTAVLDENLEAEESESSSDEDENEVSVKKRFEEIRSNLKANKLDLCDTVTLRQFAAENESYFRQNTGDSERNTLLHILVDDAKDKVVDKYKPLVKLLIDNYPNLLGEKDINEKNPLYIAIFKRRNELVRFFCDTHPNIDAILGIPCYHSETCLHVAIRRSVTPELAVFLIGLASERTLCAKNDKGNTPLHLAVEYERCTDAQFKIVKALISQCDKAMDERTGAPNFFSPYRYHEHTRSKAAPAEAERKESANAIRGYLKLHCMRTRDHDDTMDFLYGQNQGKQIYFDLYDYPSERISEDFINEGLSHLKFENILQYVALRRMELEKKVIQKPPKPSGKGRRDMVFIFDFLRKKSVDRVIRIIVDDTLEPAHSDEAIEDALRDLKVEIWDWRKMDLCTETIFTAAPDAREVYLYWSGNNAVLRGWSEPEGLNRLAKLEKVHLHVEQGLETTARTEEHVKSFINRLDLLHRDIKINVDVKYAADRQREKQELTRGPIDTSREQAEQHKWLTCMEEFADFIQNIPFEPREPLTIALIDDGVDINEQSLHGKIIDGRSFCHRDKDQNLSKPHYVTSRGHGTAMASLICRVFPKAQLYVLKLEEYMNENSKRQITARSAARAVLAAIDRRVDIISMSWTIERTPNNASDIDDLESAIEAAAKEGILMLCAANDQGVEHDKTFPAACGRTKRIFKIGAANAPGWPAEYVNPKEVDFIFPGHNVLKERPGDRSVEKSKPLTGSSVATAIAAGLAALLLYCVQLSALHTEAVDQQYQHLSNAVTMDDFKAIKRHEKMKEAFLTMTSQGSENKFVEVWHLFGPAAKKAKGRIPEEKKQIVTELVQKLKANMTFE
ncbi:hypothetical protein DL770_000391 [Monosporascus sp. CRB-9-2]|nr:hypothetical protein DL770_000391 [Monosporascus sp. CRB-9-2]